MKIFVIRAAKRCTVETQLKHAAEFGADEHRIWVIGTKRGEYKLQDVIRAATTGDEVGIMHVWLFADPAQRGARSKARDQMHDVVAALLAKGASLTETSTGRTCSGYADLALMLKDANNVLAGLGKGGKSGAPKLQIWTDEQVLTIADIWNRKDLTNNPMRIAEVHTRGDEFQKFNESAWYREIRPALAQLKQKS